MSPSNLSTKRPSAGRARLFRSTVFLTTIFSLCISRSLLADEETGSTEAKYSWSLRLAGEGECLTSGDSRMNPSNILERPDTRTEAFAIGNMLYKGLGGVFETEIRFGHEYTAGSSSAGFSDSMTKFDINQLYYQKKTDGIALLVGRKKIRWGVAYSYSPTDLVSQIRTPEDPEDRLGIIKGADVLQLSLSNDISQFDIAYLPRLNWGFDDTFFENSRLAVRWYRFMEPYDVSLVGTVDEDGRWAAGFNTSATYGKALELHAEYLYTSSKSRQYPDASIDPSSFTIPFFETCSGGYHEILIGGQYTFKNNLNLTLEYLFTSAGYSADQFREYSAHVEYLNSQYSISPDPALAGLYESASHFLLPLRKNYLFSRLYHPDVVSSIALEIYSYISLCDGSGFFVFQPKYEKAKNYEVYLQLKKFWGKKDSEFGLVPEDFSAIAGVSLFLGS